MLPKITLHTPTHTEGSQNILGGVDRKPMLLRLISPAMATRLYLLPRAALRKYPVLCGLNHRISLSCSSGAELSEIQVTAALVP